VAERRRVFLLLEEGILKKKSPSYEGQSLRGEGTGENLSRMYHNLMVLVIKRSAIGKPKKSADYLLHI
jgi:hypothetical protein